MIVQCDICKEEVDIREVTIKKTKIECDDCKNARYGI
jgi:hypothetical protein